MATAPIKRNDDVCYWRITTDRALTVDGRFRWHSGHWSALARNASVACFPHGVPIGAGDTAGLILPGSKKSLNGGGFKHVATAGLVSAIHLLQ